MRRKQLLKKVNIEPMYALSGFRSPTASCTEHMIQCINKDYMRLEDGSIDGHLHRSHLQVSKR